MRAPVILSAVGQQSSEGRVSRVSRLLHRGRGRRPERNRKCLLRGHGSSGDAGFYHLRVTVTVGLGVGAQGRQGGGQGVGVCGDVVLVVIIIRLGRPLRVTAGEEVGAGP